MMARQYRSNGRGDHRTMHTGGGMGQNPPATAAYNFVSLAPCVVASPIEDYVCRAGKDDDKDAIRQESYRRYVKEHGHLSGYLSLVLTAKSSLFVGSGIVQGKKDDKEDLFFSAAGQLLIPGSTLRGLIKNLLKLVTCGAMRPGEDFTDKHLYFRTMADKYVRSYYQSQLVRQVGPKEVETKAEAGFLIHECRTDRWAICPATYDVEEGAPWDIAKKSPSVDWSAGNGDVVCYTGKMFKKAHYTVHHVQSFATEHRLPIPADVMESYVNDVTRAGVDLRDPKYAKTGEAAEDFTREHDIDHVIPCFFLKAQGCVKSFGFGRYYRLPYQSKISAHVPKELKTEAVDFADALFGRKELWGSRLSFGDAKPCGTPERDDCAYHQTLGSPKPTSFQLYLEQKTPGVLRHWDSPEAKIRGYKMYWNQGKSYNWKENAQQGAEEHKENVNPNKICPVKAGSQFKAKLRFENLSEAELGALLAVFDLLEKGNRCVKIGMGKSIGLGSTQIRSTLFLIDERSSYENLFQQDGAWEKAEREEKERQPYLDAFQSIMDKQLDEKGRKAHEYAMKELATLLDDSLPQQNGWEEKTRTMTIDRADKPFQSRFVLPEALVVAGRKKQ